MSLAYKKDMASVNYSDVLNHFSEESEEAKKALKELHEAVKHFMESGTKLPGLVLPERTGQKPRDREPENGVMKLEVFKYYSGRLSCRLGNGMPDDFKWTGDISLFRDGQTEPMLNLPDMIFANVSSGTFKEYSFMIPDQLTAGVYNLVAGGHRCSFEIR